MDAFLQNLVLYQEYSTYVINIIGNSNIPSLKIMQFYKTENILQIDNQSRTDILIGIIKSLF